MVKILAHVHQSIRNMWMLRKYSRCLWKRSYVVIILVNQGLSDHVGSHKNIVVKLLEGTMIFQLTEVDGMNYFHLYGTACLV